MAIKTVKLVASNSYLAPYYAATNHIEDTRSINPTPKTVETQTVKYDFKQNTLVDVPDTTYSYCVVQTIRPWSDNSGGLPIQIAYKKRQSDGLPMMYIRCSNDDLSSWNSWYEIYHSGNFAVTNNLVDRSSAQTITGQKTFTNMQLFDGGLQSNSFVRAEQYAGSGGTIIIRNDTSTMTFGARTLDLTIVSYGRPNVKEYYNTSNYYTREVAYVSDLSSFVKVSGSLSTSGRIVTVASTTGSITQSNYSISTTVFNDATQVPTSKAVYDYVTPVLSNTRTASSMILELTVGGNEDSISISQASANYAGLMTASMYNTMQSLETIDNNYQKKIVEEITGTMGSVGGTLYFSAIATKFVYEGLTKISGSIKVSSYSSSNTYKYRIINPSTFNSKLSSNFSVTISKFLKGYWWASLKSTSDGSILGYGTDAVVEDSNYIGFGRIYATSGSRGSWAQDIFYNNCANGVLHFEVWFTV